MNLDINTTCDMLINGPILTNFSSFLIYECLDIMTDGIFMDNQTSINKRFLKTEDCDDYFESEENEFGDYTEENESSEYTEEVESEENESSEYTEEFESEENESSEYTEEFESEENESSEYTEEFESEGSGSSEYTEEFESEENESISLGSDVYIQEFGNDLHVLIHNLAKNIKSNKKSDIIKNKDSIYQVQLIDDLTESSNGSSIQNNHVTKLEIYLVISALFASILLITTAIYIKKMRSTSTVVKTYEFLRKEEGDHNV